MLSKMLLQTFLDYNYRVNERILQAMAALTPEQLALPTGISHGSALELIRHMADTEWSWRLYTDGGADGKFLWDVEDISDLTKLADFWSAERARMLAYLDAMSEEALAEKLELSPSFSAPRWQVFLHIVNHSSHHRSELYQYLAQCGHAVPEEETEFIRFDAAAE
ncbi:MAG: DinB family protein [Caldilineaceae bacterium]